MSKRNFLRLLGFVATAVLAVVIAVLTLAPVPEGNIPGSDKFHHVIGFAALAFPLPFVRPRLLLQVMVGVSLYGGLIELIQPAFGRSAEWSDFLADIAGAVLGAGLGAASGRLFRRRLRSGT